MEKTKNEHDGHRQRLIDMAFNSDLDSIGELQTVELALFFIFPRGNTNPLAHKLLKKFGSFSNILNADINDLCSVSGIKEQSAKKIKLMLKMFHYYTKSRSKERANFSDISSTTSLLEKLLRYRTTETLFIFAVDHNFGIIEMREFDNQKSSKVGIMPLEIYNFIASTHPRFLVVAHNHPGGRAVASPDDHNAVKFLNDLLKNFDCDLLDSFIVGEEGIYSESREGFIKHFDNITWQNSEEN